MLLLVIVILLISAGVLYFGRLRTLTTKEAPRPPEKFQEPGELIITYSKPLPNEFLRTVILNTLTVDNVSVGEIEVGGEKKSLLNLTVSFNHEGIDRKLKIPIVDKIVLKDIGTRDFEDRREIDVTALRLEKGAMINLGFSYIPDESDVDKGELIQFCEKASYRLCLKYIDIGFGDKAVNFDTYLAEILESHDTSLMDYTIAFPNTIFIFR